jgi:hypothetical protein
MPRTERTVRATARRHGSCDACAHGHRPDARNQEGRPPTRDATETEDRLDEKEHQDRGQANTDRTEAKIGRLKD